MENIPYAIYHGVRTRRTQRKKLSSLLHGRPLKNKELQTSLTELFTKYEDQSAKLSNLGSTQANESFKGIVASKAPKTRFYSGTASINHRVAAGVAQKNIGHSYISNVS